MREDVAFDNSKKEKLLFQAVGCKVFRIAELSNGHMVNKSRLTI